MAKSANSKVIFVPMQLQGDVGNQLSGGSNSFGALVQNEASESSGGLGVTGRAGILNSVADA
jgi:erythrocyte band 7 integral membrane protein